MAWIVRGLLCRGNRLQAGEDDVGDFLADRLCGALVVGVGSVGQNNDEQPAGGVADYRSARIACVTECCVRSVVALDPGVAGIDIETIGAAVRLLAGQHGNRLGTQDSSAFPDAVLEQHAAVYRQVADVGE